MSHNRILHLPLGLLLAACAGCSTARLTLRPPAVGADPGVRRSVVIEPFFEDSNWETRLTAETAQVYTYDGRVGEVMVYRKVAKKPVFARLPVLAEEQRAVIAELRRLRPSWQVLSPSELPPVNGPVSLVRVIVGPAELAGSNRPLKSLALLFGFILPPLWLFELGPVEEVQRVTGLLQRFDADAAELRGRLLRYPTQPDFAVDTRGLRPIDRPYMVDLEYQEGLWASEQAREPVLIAGFTRHLAAAVVRLIEQAP